jgi:hypothetical protein
MSFIRRNSRRAPSEATAGCVGSSHPTSLFEGYMPLLAQSRLIQSIRSVSLPGWIADSAVYIYVLLVGVFQFTHYPRAADFVTDATYTDLARSILEHGSYQIRFMPQTTLPPGLSLILAMVGRFAGLSPAVMFRVVAVFTALGLIATYELLRRVEGRGLAAVACLLLASCPAMFIFNTGVVFPEMAFLFASMLALLLALKIDRSEQSSALIGWELLLGIVLGFAVLIRSVGIALLAGVCAWSVASLLLAPELGKRRIRRFAIPLVLGLAAQLSWSVWAHHHQVLEWQLPGYPESYLSQLKVKDGQNPELGLAHLSDIPRRVEHNAITRAARFSQLLTREHISQFWSSPLIIGVLVLVATGLTSSFANGGQLNDWYFLAYETVFLFWPWETADRFLYPVVPLGCLYLWRGIKTLRGFSIRQPKAAGIGFAFFGSLLCLISAMFALRIATFPDDIQHVKADQAEPIIATLFWAALAVVGFGMLAFHSLDGSRQSSRLARFGRILSSGPAGPLRLLTILIIAVLVGSGSVQLRAIGRENLKPDITSNLYPEIEASEWIDAHEASDRVIMAREPEFVFHYTHRRVVWFPPISDPKILMDGIRRYHVELVVVTNRPESYWQPSDDVCFQLLWQAFPSSFHLVSEGPNYWVYEVLGS